MNKILLLVMLSLFIPVFAEEINEDTNCESYAWDKAEDHCSESQDPNSIDEQHDIYLDYCNDRK